MVKITRITSGCGYVYVSWIVIGNPYYYGNLHCSIGRIFVTLSSVNVDITSVSSRNSHNFTGLPADTVFNVTVIGTSLRDVFVNSAMTTVVLESTYVFA